MANPNKRLPGNVEGEFFVDTTCINCDTCRQLAPGVFRDTGTHSVVGTQPRDLAERRSAYRALLACPTGSIGSPDKAETRRVIPDFPLLLEGCIYYSGFNSARSAGGNSYFVRHPAGNWLIDSPRCIPPLVQRLDELGGVRYLFLTHRDDVADAERFAGRFGCERIIHRADAGAQPQAERILDGTDPLELAPGFLAIPTPGHTRGHCVLLFENRYLFSGDHLHWCRDRHLLTADRSTCWFSWPEQTASMRRLQAHEFEWVLPAHGQRIELSRADMARHLADLATRMESTRPRTQA